MSRHAYDVNKRAEIARRKLAQQKLEQDQAESCKQKAKLGENMDEAWDYGEGTSAQGALGQWATAQERTPTPVPPAPACNVYEQLPDGSTLKHFPIAEAGSLISNEQAPQTDPKAYLKSCGSLGDPDKFEIAELLVTTGLLSSLLKRCDSVK
ncbi:hypothetical protein FRC12_022890 [Ceratobasidium sp. 428]|nr:hypothetical protein FRC12_022890 [Ceratobasidium sp. 428]